MDNKVIFMYRVRKYSKILLLILLFVLIGLTIYEYIRVKPNNVHFTNISSTAITVSWNTKTPTPGFATVVNSKNNIPISFFNIGKNVGYDTRDIKEAELDATVKTAENIYNNDTSVITMNDIVTEIKVSEAGKYYTHHVEIKNLDPNTEYKVLVGDGLMYTLVKDVEEKNIVSTVEIPENVLTPVPAYGTVKDADNRELSPEELIPVTDAVVYFTLFDEKTGNRSSTASSTMNSEGNWYIDASFVVDKSGESFIDLYDRVFIEFFIDAGPLGQWETIFNDFFSPFPMLVLNLDSVIKDESIPGSLIKISKSSNPFLNNILAYDEKIGDTDILTPIYFPPSEGEDDPCSLGPQWRIINNVKCFKECTNGKRTYECPEQSSLGTGSKGTLSPKPPMGYTCELSGWCKCVTKDTAGYNSEIPCQDCDTAGDYSGHRCFNGDGKSWDQMSQLDRDSITALCGAQPNACHKLVTQKAATGNYMISCDWEEIPGCVVEPPSKQCNDDEFKRACIQIGGTPKQGLKGCECDDPDEANNQCTDDEFKGACIRIGGTPKQSINGCECNDPIQIPTLCDSDFIRACIQTGRTPKQTPGNCQCSEPITKCDADFNRACIETGGTPKQGTNKCECNDLSVLPSIGQPCTEIFPESRMSIDIKTGEVLKCQNGKWAKAYYLLQDELNCREFLKNRSNNSCSTSSSTFCSDSSTGVEYQCVIENGIKIWKVYNRVPIKDIPAHTVSSIEKGDLCINPPCHCSGSLIPLTSNQYCPEISGMDCSINGPTGKICNKDGSTCEKNDFRDAKGDVKGSTFDCTGKPPATERTAAYLLNIFPSLVKYVKAQTSDPSITINYVIDSQTGMINGLEPGLYSFEYNGQQYAFEYINTSDESQGILVYIDTNSNGTYDEGTDTKVSELASQITIKAEALQYKYTLKEGLNFISLPYVITNEEERTAAGLLQSLNDIYGDKIYSISKYDGTWKIVGQNIEIYDNNDFQLLPGQGYIFKAKEDVDIEIWGKPVQFETTQDSAAVTLFEGWNLIGLYGNNIKQYTAKTLIQDINTYEPVDFTADNVSQWEKESQKYDGLQLDIENGVEMVYGFDYPLDTLTGYFVRIKQGRGNWQPSIKE